MMNLSMSHPVPQFGDSLTVTCYVCGMPSSKEWAQKVRSRPTTPMKPYFPFLLQISPIGGAVLREDGSTYLCAFCHASLEAQWNVYESQQVVPPPNRKYNIQKFICGVCGVETYRKRIRALPFQEFPFLEKQRQAGSITLGNNPLAVVCLDCSETLWAQSAEYDRWGLPVQKRHFNWMARPPPPEDSVEATVARLPSGETQLPRCPPIEPAIVPSRHDSMTTVKIVDSALAAKNRSKGKGDSPKLETARGVSSPIPPTGRKTSLTSTTPPALDMGFHNQQPPVVTVAPMSSHTTVISLRKDSIGLPPGIYPQPGSGVYPTSATYVPYVWGNTTREPGQRIIEAYPYGAATTGAPEAIQGPPGTWPWLPHPSADLIRYQSYVSSLQSRSIGESTVTRSPTHSAGSSSTVMAYGPSNSPTRYPSTATVTISRLQDSDRSSLEDHRGVTITTARRPTAGTGASPNEIYPRKNSPDAKSGIRSPKTMAVTREAEIPSTSRTYPLHHKKLPKDPEATTTTLSQEAPVQKETTVVTVRTIQDEDDTEKNVRRELHIPKKRNWQVFMKDSQSLAQPPPPEKRDEMPTHPKKKKSSLSISELSTAEVSSSIQPVSKDDSSVKYPVKLEIAMDLTVSTPGSASGKSSKGAGGKFMIEYLCQSETSSKQDGAGGDDTAPRTSVIRCAPKVPIQEEASEMDKSDTETVEETNASNKKPVDDVGTRKDASPVKDDAGRKREEARALRKNDSDDKEERKTLVKGKVGGDGGDHDDHCKVDDTKGKDEDSKDETKGNSERQAQDSTMHSHDVHDDDETKNEDLPNLEQFIKETVLELVNREKHQEKKKKEQVQEQKQFLNELGLITPDKKIELEIKTIVSRHERKTLPPLKLRVDTKNGRKIDKKLKELLLKVSLEDPSLFQEKPESEKCDFMAELGMKTAKKSEKTKREIKWRVVLMERMRRELRDATTRGVKHEWEKADILKKFADCDLDSFFNSLSFASLLSPDDELDKEKTPEKQTGEEECSKGNRVCINYPKYIPSYAVTGSDAAPVKVELDMDSASATVEMSSTESKEVVLPEPILKIPVIPSKHRLQSESSSVTTAASDTDDSSDIGGVEDTKIVPANASIPSDPSFNLTTSTSDTYPIRIDNLIQCSATYWEQMKRGIDHILNDLESTKEDDIPTEEKTIQMEKIRKHLKSQLSDIKCIEKRLRATGKTILSANRRKIQNKKETTSPSSVK